MENANPKPPKRAWLLWVAVLAGILLLALFRNRSEPGAEVLSQYQFEQLVTEGRIARATVAYDQQNSALNTISGTYNKVLNNAQVEVPFRVKVRMTRLLEERLLALPQFEVREPNTVLLNLVWSLLPIVIIAVIIWFFFIRQIRLATKSGPSLVDLNTHAKEQQDRFDQILGRWEEQGRRMDAVLAKMERDHGVQRPPS